MSEQAEIVAEAVELRPKTALELLDTALLLKRVSNATRRKIANEKTIEKEFLDMVLQVGVATADEFVLSIAVQEKIPPEELVDRMDLVKANMEDMLSALQRRFVANLKYAELMKAEVEAVMAKARRENAELREDKEEGR